MYQTNNPYLHYLPERELLLKLASLIFAPCQFESTLYSGLHRLSKDYILRFWLGLRPIQIRQHFSFLRPLYKFCDSYPIIKVDLSTSRHIFDKLLCNLDDHWQALSRPWWDSSGLQVMFWIKSTMIFQQVSLRYHHSRWKSYKCAC